MPSTRKSCCVSRSFSQPIENIEELVESVASYGSRVAEKIRKENLISQLMSVFVFTNHFNRKEKQYANSIRLQLDFPTNNSSLIVKKAVEGVRNIFRDGYRYKKAGVILYELHDASSVRGLLDYNREQSELLMKSLDEINLRYGSSMLRLAAEGVDKKMGYKKKKNIILLYYSF